MIRVRMFDLVDSASVRGGLLSILEGGFNVIGAAEFPTTLDLELVLSLEIDADEQPDSYDLDIRLSLTCDDGDPTGIKDYQRKGTLGRRTEGAQGGNAFVLPLITETSSLLIPRPGAYRFTLYDHDQKVAHIRFFAEQVSDD